MGLRVTVGQRQTRKKCMAAKGHLRGTYSLRALLSKGEIGILFCRVGSKSSFPAVWLGGMCHFVKKVMQKTYGVNRNGFTQMRGVIGVNAAGPQILAGKAAEAFSELGGKLRAQINDF